MSHFTKVATKINNLDALRKALDGLHLQYAEGMGGETVSLRGYMHESVEARMAINMGKYDIGIVKSEDGNYELCADWWGIETTTGKTEREVVDEISHAYSCARVAMACEEAGYSLGQFEVSETGEATVTAECWS